MFLILSKGLSPLTMFSFRVLFYSHIRIPSCASTGETFYTLVIQCNNIFVSFIDFGFIGYLNIIVFCIYN